MKLHRLKLIITTLLVLVFNYVNLHAQTTELKILPLGNSLTFEDGDGWDEISHPYNKRVAYRYKLYQLLNAAGYTYDFIGSEESGSYYLGDAYDDNAGFPGMTTSQMLTLLTTGRNTTQGANNCRLLGSPWCDAFYFTSYEPDVILLHIGTNGLLTISDANEFILDVEQMLDTINYYETIIGHPIHVFLAQIINRYIDDDPYPTHEPTNYYNALLNNLVNSRSGDELELVNLSDGTTPPIDYRHENDGGDMVDEYHPNSNGYNKMASGWFEALENYNIQAPVISEIPNQTINEGETFTNISLDNYGFDPQEAPADISWSIIPASPAYLNITIDGSRIVSIAPKNPEWDGSETIIFKAEDSGNGSTPLYDLDTVVFTVFGTNDPPVINDQYPISTDEETAVEITFADLDVEDPDDPYPTGFSLHVQDGTNYTRTGNTITPVLDFVGTLSVDVYVNDGDINSNTFPLEVTVNNVNDNPSITLPSVRTVLEDATYNKIVTASDVDAGDELTLSAPVLPDWLDFEPATGALSGTPEYADVGIHPVTIRVNDETVNVDSSFTIEVINVNDKPEILSTPEDTMLIPQDDFSYMFQAIDEESGTSLIYFVTQKPSWLVYNYGTNELSGSPGSGDIGIHPVTLGVSDGVDSSLQAFNIHVSDYNFPPVITSTPEDTAYEDIQYIYALKASDNDGDPLTYDSIQIPGWTEFYASGVLIGTPQTDDLGSYTVILSVTDGENIVYDTFNLEVVGINDKPVVHGPVNPLYALKETPFSISLQDLDVEDNDNVYPDDFTLNLLEGDNYTLIDNTIIPYTGFLGDLGVQLRVNDGTDFSDPAIINVEVKTTLSVETHINSEEIIVYPNPVKDYVTFELHDKLFIQPQLVIFNSSMQIVDIKQDYSSTALFDYHTSHLKNGIYFYRITDKNFILTGKFIRIK